MSTPHTRRLPVLFALVALASGDCAPSPEITFCQADAMRLTMMTEAGARTMMYVYPVLYVRVYGSAWLEGTINSITVLNGSTPLRMYSSLDFLVDPGGAYQCYYASGGQPNQGLGPIDITGLNPASISVRIAVTKMGSSPEVLTMPIGRLRPLTGTMMPNFDCTSTHCGR